MAPKKDNNGNIVNMYEKIPKHLLDNAENPNFHLHKLKLPFRAICVAPSGSGKSNLIVNLISLFSQGKKGTFATINIVTRNKDEPLYKYLELISEGQIIITEGLETLPQLDKFDKDVNHLVVVDDLVLAKDQSRVESYYIRARKLNVSIIYLSQSFYRIPKIIRSNCSYMFILKLGGKRDLNLILSEMSLSTSKETLLKIYEHCTKEKFNFLLVDIDAPEDQRFRHNLLDVINVADYL